MWTGSVVTDKVLLSGRLSGGNEEITKRTQSVWSVSLLTFGPRISSVRVEYMPYLFTFFVTSLRTEASPSFCTFFLSRLDGPGFKFRQGQEIFFPPKPSRLATGPSQPPIQRVPGFCLGVKRLGREVDNSPSGAENRNGWSCTSASPICTGTTMPFTFIFRIYVSLLFVTVKNKAEM